MVRTSIRMQLAEMNEFPHLRTVANVVYISRSSGEIASRVNLCFGGATNAVHPRSSSRAIYDE